MAGSPVATENYTVKKSDSGFEIDGSGSASLGPMKIDIERFEVLTDAKYQPSAGDRRKPSWARFR